MFTRTPARSRRSRVRRRWLSIRKRRKSFFPRLNILRRHRPSRAVDRRVPRSPDRLWSSSLVNHRAAEVDSNLMKFSFLVGTQEQHQVDFSFDQFAGNLEIRVDGQPLVADFRLLSLRLTK